MADPIAFLSTSNLFGLPLLFAGQAQKEFTVNQAITMIDSLLAGVVKDSMASPPQSATDGECYRISAPATGEWTTHEDAIALRIAGSWQFVEPIEGMSIFDQGAGQRLHFGQSWTAASEPAPATGGSVIDVEARQALGSLIEALRNIGIFGPAIP